MTEKPGGSILKGALWMLVLSTLLFWLPLAGPLVAGFVGGRKTGGVMGAILAALLPGLVIGAVLFFLGSLLTGLPLFGAVAGMGGFALSLFHVGPLLLGAIVGGLMA